MKSYKVIYKKKVEKFIMINKIEGIKFYKAFQEIAKSKENYKKSAPINSQSFLNIAPISFFIFPYIACLLYLV